MKFIDEAIIRVTSGNGGRGCVSFRRERYVPRGGPDGGDGGKGGDIVITTTSRRRTLHQFRFKREFKAKNGGYGQGRQKTGKNGEDLIIEVPPGTLIKNFDAENKVTGDLIRDCVSDGQTFVLAKGGIGGRGNRRFKTSTNRAPRYAQPGEPGEEKTLRLELKLLADAGIIGLPNAGKSTLLSRISAARPKIANYPFTTLTPTIGVVSAGFGEPFTVADIPGLIEGAHTGVGLGIRFLKHVERTKILIHLIDASSIEQKDPLASWRAINRELAGYDKPLSQKPQIIVLNKLDITGSKAMADCFKAALRLISDDHVISISAVTGEGVDDFLKELYSKI
ncbi:MAG: GTPase ObgE [Deltaproteobacteria bacterium]|nr:GTPase ObgE [Deltaproteobacteria bacterium]